MTKRYVALILALILSLTLLPAAMAETAEPEKISYWADMNANMAQTISNLDENLTWQKMQEIFNVDIAFDHPAVGAAAETFNLMIAGREFPDVIEYAWTSYNGGPEKAISDEIIIDLTPYFTPEIMPNLYAYLQENPNIRKQVLTDNGVLYCFPCINISPYKSTSGYIANTDMMAAAGVEEILTIADVDKLARYAQSQGVETPINISSGNILKDTAAGAFGVGYSWYIDDGEVKFGPFEENYKAYIKQYAQWYQDGLLNPDFVALTNGQIISSLVEGNTAFTFGYMASCMNTARTTAKSQGKTLNLLGVQYPHSELVEKPIFTGRGWDFSTNTNAAITVACKNPELVCRMMDYFYGKEGNLLKNFGVEGYTYNMVDGKPVYSDVIMNDPDHSWRVKMAGMLRCDVAFPGFIVEQFHEISFGFADDAEGISAQTAATWQLYNDYCANYKFPQLTPTEDESDAQKCGEAVGYLAVKDRVDVRDVDYEKLEKKLRASGCLTEKNHVGFMDSRLPARQARIKMPLSPEEIKAGLASDSPGMAIWQAAHAWQDRSPLYAFLADENDHLRIHAAMALALAGEDAGAEILLKCVRKQDDFVPATSRKYNMIRGAASLYLLGRIAYAPALDDILHIIQDWQQIHPASFKKDEFLADEEEYRFQYLSQAIVAAEEIALLHPAAREKTDAVIHGVIDDPAFSIHSTLKGRQQLKYQMADMIRHAVDCLEKKRK